MKHTLFGDMVAESSADVKEILSKADSVNDIVADVTFSKDDNEHFGIPSFYDGYTAELRDAESGEPIGGTRGFATDREVVKLLTEGGVPAAAIGFF